MKLPSLKVALPLIFLVWCIVGVLVHGWVMLAYPAMWAGVGLFFWVLHLLLRAPAAPESTETTSTQATTGHDESDAPENRQMSATA